MLIYHCKGVDLVTIVTDLSKKYEVKKCTIYNDWKRRERWLNEIFDFNLPQEILYGIKVVVPSAWKEYLSADNSNARIGALRLAMDAYTRIFDRVPLSVKQAIMEGVKTDYEQVWERLSQHDRDVIKRAANVIIENRRMERSTTLH